MHCEPLTLMKCTILLRSVQSRSSSAHAVGPRGVCSLAHTARERALRRSVSLPPLVARPGERWHNHTQSNAARFHSALLRSELSCRLRYCTHARDGNAAPHHSLALLPSELAQSLFHTLSMSLASPSLLFDSLRVASHQSGPRLPRSDDTACLPPVRVPCRLPSLASLRHRHRHRHRLCQCLSLTLCLSFFLSSLLFSSL